MSNQNNILIMGGFAESRRALEPVADEAVRQGFGEDADILTLREANMMDVERLRARMAGANVLAHSAGVITTPDARHSLHDSELPKNFVIVAAPEPRGIVRLARAAVAKSANHLLGFTESPRSAHRRVVAGNTAELLAHPLTNIAALAPEIAHFSTLDRVASGQIAAEDRIGYFPMEDDEFYVDSWVQRFDDTRSLINAGGVVRRLEGGHDALLTNPQGVLNDIDHTYARGHIGQPLVARPLT